MLAAGTTNVEVSSLLEAQLLIDQATELLSIRTREEGLRLNFDRDAIALTRAGKPWGVFRHNPLGIPLLIQVCGGRASATLNPNALLEGPPRLLHGGFTAAMMDALLSTLVQAQDIRAVTVRLDVQFLEAVPLDLPLELSGEVLDVSGRKVTARGTMSRNGTPVARADALLITVPGEPD
jgi:acyl-coenzyme A thioesterase PaaI-like protein